MPELFKHCKFTVCDKLPDQNETLRAYISDTLNFRIIKYLPLTIEKENVTHQDCLELIETLKAKYEPEANDSIFMPNSESHCNQTLVQRTKKNEVCTKNISPDKTLGESNIQSSAACDSEDIKDVIDKNVSNQPSSFSLGCMEINETAKKSLAENLEHLLLGSSVITAPLSLSSDVQAPQNINDSITEYTLNWSEYWNFKCAEWHLSTESYKPYFENATIKEAQVTFRINRSDPEARAFIKQVRQLKFEKIGFNIRDKEQAMKLLKQVEGDTGTTMTIFDNLILIVGMKKEEVSRAKKLITEKLQNLDSTESESAVFKYNQDKSNNMGGSSQASGNDTRRSEQGMTLTQMLRLLDHPKAVNVMSLFREKDTFPSIQRYSQPSSYHNPQRFITEKCKVVVQIHKADITTFKADVIVNATNQKLQLDGSVSRAISNAAGPELSRECEDFINSGNILNVTEIFKSKGWKLPAKFVFHAVGPRWDAYVDKQKCIVDLRHTVLRCLVEAGSQGASSIALPSISAALFKVPKELCARCYMEAVKHFDVFSVREGCSLREIHFIDVDDTMVKYITECFTENWDKVNDPEKLKNDLDFAKFHLLSIIFKTQVASKVKLNTANAKSPSSVAGAREPASANATGKSLSVSGAREPAFANAIGKSLAGTRQPAFANAIGKSLSVAGARQPPSANATGKRFQFRNFTLELKSGHAFDYRAGITITIGKPFDKLSGLPNFKIEQNLKKVDKMPYKKKSYRFYEVTKPGTKWSRLLLAVYPEPDTVEAIANSFGNLELAIQKCDKSEIHGKIVNGLIITSHMLYNDTKGKHSGAKKVDDSQKIGKFADTLHQFMEKLSDTAQANISTTVVGDDISLPLIQRAMESHLGPAHVSGVLSL